MIKVIKIYDYDSIDKVLEHYYSSNNLVIERALNRSRGELELFYCIELSCKLKEYFFNIPRINPDLDYEGYSNLEGLIEGIKDMLSKEYNTSHNIKISPVFYTVTKQESGKLVFVRPKEFNKEKNKIREDDILEYMVKAVMKIVPSHGLTDKEIEKFQNLFKVAVN